MNLSNLAQAHFEKKETVTINNLPLIAFGGTDPETRIGLVNVFELAFDRDVCLLA